MSHPSDTLFSGDGGTISTVVADDCEANTGGGDAVLTVCGVGDSPLQPPRPSWSTTVPMSDNHYG